jgi:hypothetical protein
VKKSEQAHKAFCVYQLKDLYLDKVVPPAAWGGGIPLRLPEQGYQLFIL